MSVGLADVWKGIYAAWTTSSLNTLFKALWQDPTDTTSTVLHDVEAKPGQPKPYCWISQLTPKTSIRMSGPGGEANNLREVRDIPILFSIRAGAVNGDTRSPKQIAAYLAEEVMKVFGGHPTIASAALPTLDNGNVISLSYQTDYYVRGGVAAIDTGSDLSESYTWCISYLMRIDVPVKS